MHSRVLVIGVGNRLRGDDAAGLETVTRLRERGLPAGVTSAIHEGEAIGLAELWDGVDAVVLVDAVASDGPPGTIHRIDATHRALPAALHHGSSHAIGLAEAIELGRVLGTLPDQVVMYGIEGVTFELGAPLSEEVASAIDGLVARVCTEALRLAGQ